MRQRLRDGCAGLVIFSLIDLASNHVFAYAISYSTRSYSMRLPPGPANPCHSMPVRVGLTPLLVIGLAMKTLSSKPLAQVSPPSLLPELVPALASFLAL